MTSLCPGTTEALSAKVPFVGHRDVETHGLSDVVDNYSTVGIAVVHWSK